MCEQNENNNAAAGNAIMVRPLVVASNTNASALSHASVVKSDRAQSKRPVKSDRAQSNAPVVNFDSADTKTSKKRNRNTAFGEK